MEFNEFLKLISRKVQTIFTLTLVIVMMVMLASLVGPLKYSVESRLLVVQNTSTSDAYALSRSNEYLGNLLSEVVYSGSFFDQVKASKYNIDQNYFSGDYSRQLKKWHKTVETSTMGDTGIIEINVYHVQTAEAKKIALAVNDILINNNQDYHGGQNVKINVLDQPLVSSYPTKPNLLFNGVLAVLAALVFSLFYIYIFPEEKYSIYLLGKSEKKQIKHKAQQSVKPAELEYYGTKEYQANDYEQENYNNEAETADLSGNIRNIIGR